MSSGALGGAGIVSPICGLRRTKAFSAASADFGRPSIMRSGSSSGFFSLGESGAGRAPGLVSDMGEVPSHDARTVARVEDGASADPSERGSLRTPSSAIH